MFGKSRGKHGELVPEPHDGPPDSERRSGLCPRCDRLSSFDLLGSLPLTFDGNYSVDTNGSQHPTYNEQATVLVCRHCRQGVCVLEEEFVGGASSKSGRGGGAITWRGFHWWPLSGAKTHPAVPPPISAALGEAVVALSANCPRASAVMARRTLEAVAFDKGETDGVLAVRLKRMAERGLLHESLADWSKEVRLIGNVGAHFDPIEDVSNQDARQLLKFITALLEYIYVLPAELAARRSQVP